MALPKITAVSTTHTLTLDDDLTVTFRIVPIPGSVYASIIDAHRDADGTAPHEAVAADMLTAGIADVYSSVESTPVEFTAADAAELWQDWPEWARWNIYRAVIDYSTRGPAADPFGKSRQNENGDK